MSETKLPFTWTDIPMQPYHSSIPAHQCGHCKNSTLVGDGGEYMGTWEFYFLACRVIKDKYGMLQNVDPYSDPPDDNGNNSIVTDCSLFVEAKP